MQTFSLHNRVLFYEASSAVSVKIASVLLLVLVFLFFIVAGKKSAIRHKKNCYIGLFVKYIAVISTFISFDIIA